MAKKPPGAIEIRFTERQKEAVAAIAREYFYQLKQRASEFSETIADTLTLSRVPYKDKDGKWRMRIASPYFWSGILDIGRGPVRPQRGTVLIWFRDPDDDPRTDYGTNYPKTYTEARARRLSQADYEYGLAKNREAYQNGSEPYMIVRPYAGPFEGFNFTTQAFVRLSTAQKRMALEPIVKYAEEIIRHHFPKKRYRI